MNAPAWPEPRSLQMIENLAFFLRPFGCLRGASVMRYLAPLHRKHHRCGAQIDKWLSGRTLCVLPRRLIV